MSSEEHVMVLDECMPQEDVARIAYSMYGQYIDSIFFSKKKMFSTIYFSVQENLQLLFDDLN